MPENVQLTCSMSDENINNSLCRFNIDLGRLNRPIFLDRFLGLKNLL
jgi:hypothetical protein